MPETVLSLPLSGLEIRKAILDHVGRRLQGDCYLNDDTAYDRMECTITISLKCHDVGRVAAIDQTIVVRGMAPEANPDDALLELADAEFQINSNSPNQTRVESGQPVPVLGTKDGKPDIKSVKYPRHAVGGKQR